MNNHADYGIVQVADDIVFIKDLDLGNKSITNDAEYVVESLIHAFGPGRRIVYKDSEGCWDELKHDGVRFTNFAPYRDSVPY